MLENNSPWLAQLKNRRMIKEIESDHGGEIAIIGGGIAGVSTAYFLLRDTAHQVVLVEATRIAHGATGHNAGQVVAAFERPMEDLVAEFGLEQATGGQKALDDTWVLIDEIFRDTKLKTPYYRFTGYNGYIDIDVVIRRLAKSFYLKQAGLPSEEVLLIDSLPAEDLAKIPKEYEGLYKFASKAEILALLETADERFIASVATTKGVMNSALFCEEVIEYLEATHPDRFKVLEHSPVAKIDLKADGVEISIKEKSHKIKASRVVLCTNGFENLHITNDGLVNIDGKFHHEVEGVVGYMAGYLAEEDAPPTAIAYFDYLANERDAAYFYLTRRPYEDNSDSRNLIAVGGPETPLPEVAQYHPRYEYLPKAGEDIDKFLHRTFKPAPAGEIDYQFKWHGLMGYTKSRVRLIGAEPCHERLLYNIGCNGVGIIPSIYGGWKIAQIVAGKKPEPSIFDPKDLRCAVPK